MTERIFIGLGSNIDPDRNIAEAFRRLAGQATILGLSTFYHSPADGDPGGPPFINGAVEIVTPLGPEAVKWQMLRPIEEALGRVRTADKNSPRTIDLDLLLYGERVVDTPRLTLPDPNIARYPFVAVPLLELAPDLILPGTGGQLRAAVRSMACSALEALPALTATLRQTFSDR